MALFSPSESPAVVVKEVDLTNGVANVPTSTGAFVGNFNWGPADEPTRVNNEATLVNTFGAPSTANTVDFHSAAYYLRYSDDLYIVRGTDASAANAWDSAAGVSAPVINNQTHFDTQTFNNDSHTFIAKFPGKLGNSLAVSVSTAGDADFANWPYAARFDGAPQTSTYAAGLDSALATEANSLIKDEAHVVVYDEDGEITGTKGQILETFPYVSLALGAKRSDGATNFMKNVINNQSQYIYMAGMPTAKFGTNAGTVAVTASDYTAGISADVNVSLKGGVSTTTLTTGNIATGFDKFEDPNALSIDFLIAPQSLTPASNVTIVNDLVNIAGPTVRADCMVIASPAKNDVISATPNTSIISGVSGFTRSSYLAVDNNYLKVYDKYNDNYIFIPAASSTAGIMAATDNNAAPWFSPAGTRRGQYFGVTNLLYSPSKAERDSLYTAGINPIANIPGQGILLYGDKTHLARPSAFDRINVRRLFLVLERAIAAAAQNILFEFNDEFTRAEFVNVVEPLLRDVKGRRGITDFKLVCDGTNNTPLIIDTNQFVATLFIKPARSINFITLNFTAVRTGVAFEEVVGTVS